MCIARKIQPTATYGQTSLCCSILFDGVVMAVQCHGVHNCSLKDLSLPYHTLVLQGRKNN